MRVLAAIPARYGSQRLPGKPLLEINGLPMISHVVRAARQAELVDAVLVATDCKAIAAVARDEGAVAVMTDSAIPSGTDRIEAAIRQCGIRADIVVNVQGDEPMLPPSAISSVARLLLESPSAEMSTLCAPLPLSALCDPSRVKIVCREDFDGQTHAGSTRSLLALYFSRAPIGIDRALLQEVLTSGKNGMDAHATACANEALHTCSLHLGVYGYRRAALDRFVSLPQSRLEQLERLEQLRALEAGMRILVGQVAHAPQNVDTEADLLAVRELVRRRT
uniref:3-deoxy-manno-octulosonate cytidylyltransferase n=1 Tax=Calcidiscus leptoporus TaxID=127549 RepID=A0A7S0P0R7_9EUKA|mmetsp:Transcript_48361/g.111974  ORF Transcript_48361/g.111974 Transcript_48361/m.111974 type:complete len:278 (+) Transcript_48361:90-923(+)